MPAYENPLTSLPPAEVPLTAAPLVRVIAQIRFAPVLMVEQRTYVAPFQEAIRERYPVMAQEQQAGVYIQAGGTSPLATPPSIWRFSDMEKDWTVALASDFIALETTNYHSRQDFLMRLREIVEALSLHIRPTVAQRLGVRYIDRITGEALGSVGSLIRPEMRGLATTPMASAVRHMLSEAQFALEAGDMVARWGFLPSNTTVDPTAIEPSPEPSWILDLDVFSTHDRAFQPDQICRDAEAFAERIYTFFRWTVTDEFLRRYGGSA